MSGNAYGLALSDACSGFAAMKPPNRMTVSQGAAANLVIRQPGSAGGNWDPTETPYMVHPMDALASRKHEAVVFVGPARTGKTAGLLQGWMAHNVVNDPGDMLFIQMSREKAREFSKTDIDRAIRNSDAVRAMRSTRAVDSNTFDTMFRHGMWLRIAWPTVGNVSGSTYRYVAITDIDRMENAENVDGEGPLFDLAKKRTQTFLTRGMTLVESSPGYPVKDPNWRPATAHEAPPAGGIASLYNRSDRHRLYWQCPDCSEHFQAEPGLGLFHLPPDEVLMDEVRTLNIPAFAKKYARAICPHCACLIEPRLKNELNRRSIWVPDGVTLTRDREMIGEALTSTIRGYWMGGMAAAYQNWASLIEQYLYGLLDYTLTGSEEKLKQTVNTDQGASYLSRHLAHAARNSSKPQDRAEVGMPRYVVPPETRCLLASVDVQGGSTARFEVCIMAVGPNMEQWLVDRYFINKSDREGLGDDKAPLDPAAYPEDWDVLTERLLRATWKTPIPGLELKLKALVVDTGGEAGVSHNAYAWWRRLREQGLAHKVFLYKGASEKKAPIIKETLVGKVNNKGRNDVPLLLCNPHLLSDEVDAGLKRTAPGPNYIHFPAPKHPTLNPDGWLPQSVFDELEAEVRGKNGVWAKVRARNETFDLCRMLRAGMLRLQLDKVKDWNVVPGWLAPLDRNTETMAREDRQAMKASTPVAQIDQQQVQVVMPQRRPRRVAYARL